jgi:hypothetical protein
MPRKPRFNLPGIPQHIIQRGNNREPCFLCEQDYRRYLEALHASAEKQACPGQKIRDGENPGQIYFPPLRVQQRR